ncbi:MAG: alanine racemase [Oscillospiraceae bacterium]|jgi:alanine racemase|nr:alanine racemase [Oscillospiraceae bacterium]
MNFEQMRTWAEIDIGAIEHNYRAMRARLSAGVRFLGIVKANAYGHGATQISRALEGAGCEYLGVACLDEAAELRRAGISLPILVLGHTPVSGVEFLIKCGVTQTVCGLDAAEAYSAAAGDSRLKAHIKLDTGMGRLGDWRPGDLEKAAALPGLDVEGIFTHFAESESEDGTFTRFQLESFLKTVGDLEKKTGRTFEIKHCANSGAMVDYVGAHLNMVRPGIALYGYYPGRAPRGLELRPAMSLKSRVMQVKRIGKGDTVSYGRRYTARGDTVIAVLPVGYADGLHRALSGKPEFLINGARAPQIGVICMDVCMADVTGIPGVAAGSVATLFGADGNERIFADRLAELAGTVPNEILTSISARVPRIYTRGGSPIAAGDTILFQEAVKSDKEMGAEENLFP